MPQLRVAGQRHELRLRSCQVSPRGENPGSRFLRRGTAHINLGKKEWSASLSGSLRLLTGRTLELDVLALAGRGPVQHLRLQIVARGTGDHQAPYTRVMSNLTVSSEIAHNYEFASRLREESIDRTRSCPGRHPEGGRSAAATPPDPSGRRAHMKRLSTHPRRRGTTRAQDVLCRVQAMHGRQ